MLYIFAKLFSRGVFIFSGSFSFWFFKTVIGKKRILYLRVCHIYTTFMCIMVSPRVVQAERLEEKFSEFNEWFECLKWAVWPILRGVGKLSGLKHSSYLLNSEKFSSSRAAWTPLVSPLTYLRAKTIGDECVNLLPAWRWSRVESWPSWGSFWSSCCAVALLSTLRYSK